MLRECPPHRTVISCHVRWWLRLVRVCALVSRVSSSYLACYCAAVTGGGVCGLQNWYWYNSTVNGNGWGHQDPNDQQNSGAYVSSAVARADLSDCVTVAVCACVCDCVCCCTCGCMCGRVCNCLWVYVTPHWSAVPRSSAPTRRSRSSWHLAMSRSPLPAATPCRRWAWRCSSDTPIAACSSCNAVAVVLCRRRRSRKRSHPGSRKPSRCTTDSRTQSLASSSAPSPSMTTW